MMTMMMMMMRRGALATLERLFRLFAYTSV